MRSVRMSNELSVSNLDETEQNFSTYVLRVASALRIEVLGYVELGFLYYR